MMSCDFVKGEDGAVSVENVKWVPLVYHAEVGKYAVWPVKDYSDEQAKANPAYDAQSASVSWMRDESAKIVNSLGDDFEIDA